MYQSLRPRLFYLRDLLFGLGFRVHIKCIITVRFIRYLRIVQCSTNKDV